MSLTMDRQIFYCGQINLDMVGIIVNISNCNPSIVLAQPRKTRPYLTERLLMGRKESNKRTNKLIVGRYIKHDWYHCKCLNLWTGKLDMFCKIVIV